MPALYDGLLMLIDLWETRAADPIALKGAAQTLERCAQELHRVLEAYAMPATGIITLKDAG